MINRKTGSRPALKDQEWREKMKKDRPAGGHVQLPHAPNTPTQTRTFLLFVQHPSPPLKLLAMQQSTSQTTIPGPSRRAGATKTRAPKNSAATTGGSVTKRYSNVEVAIFGVPDHQLCF